MESPTKVTRNGKMLIVENCDDGSFDHKNVVHIEGDYLACTDCGLTWPHRDLPAGPKDVVTWVR